jgi:hypothetical protein
MINNYTVDSAYILNASELQGAESASKTQQPLK